VTAAISIGRNTFPALESSNEGCRFGVSKPLCYFRQLHMRRQQELFGQRLTHFIEQRAVASAADALAAVIGDTDMPKSIPLRLMGD